LKSLKKASHSAGIEGAKKKHRAAPADQLNEGA